MYFIFQRNDKIKSLKYKKLEDEINLTLSKNKFKNSMITILMPVGPFNIENNDIFDIRITTAASGSGENAIRRLNGLNVIFFFSKNEHFSNSSNVSIFQNQAKKVPY